jgi:hypothetical protein
MRSKSASASKNAVRVHDPKKKHKNLQCIKITTKINIRYDQNNIFHSDL